MKREFKKTTVPAGEYVLEYLGGEEVAFEGGDERYRMDFKVVGGKHDGQKVSRYVNPEAQGPRAAISKLFFGLAGRAFADGVVIDDESYVGCTYRALVTVTESGFSKVESLVEPLDGETDEQPDLDEVSSLL